MIQDNERKAAGRIGEEIASEFLVRNGFLIMRRNYRKPWGEIDVIAKKGQILHFVEVKTLTRDFSPDVSRENNHYRPEEQVHPWKLEKMARTAEMYMNEMELTSEYQLDVIGVFLNIRTRTARCRLFEQVL